MNLLFHSLLFTPHLEQVLRTLLQKPLNNESRWRQSAHGGACCRPRAGSCPRPLLSRHVPPHGAGVALAPLPAVMLLLGPSAASPHSTAAQGSPAPLTQGVRGTSPP